MSFHNLLLCILHYYNTNIIKGQLRNVVSMWKRQRGHRFVGNDVAGDGKVKAWLFHWKRRSGGWKRRKRGRFIGNDIAGGGKGEEGIVSVQTMWRGVERAKAGSFCWKQHSGGWIRRGRHGGGCEEGRNAFRLAFRAREMC
jgi:hypothetical protein